MVIAAVQRAPGMGRSSGQAERGEKRDLTFSVSQHRCLCGLWWAISGSKHEGISVNNRPPSAQPERAVRGNKLWELGANH